MYSLNSTCSTSNSITLRVGVCFQLSTFLNVFSHSIAKFRISLCAIIGGSASGREPEGCMSICIFADRGGFLLSEGQDKVMSFRGAVFIIEY